MREINGPTAEGMKFLKKAKQAFRSNRILFDEINGEVNNNRITAYIKNFTITINDERLRAFETLPQEEFKRQSQILSCTCKPQPEVIFERCVSKEIKMLVASNRNRKHEVVRTDSISNIHKYKAYLIFPENIENLIDTGKQLNGLIEILSESEELRNAMDAGNTLICISSMIEKVPKTNRYRQTLENYLSEQRAFLMGLVLKSLESLQKNQQIKKIMEKLEPR